MFDQEEFEKVTYLFSDKKVIEREFWNLLEIPDNYEKIVLSLDDLLTSDYKWIKHYNILDYLQKTEKSRA